MQAKLAAFLFLSSSPAVLHAQSLATVDFHGSGSDSANAITTDSAGNIYIAGTTTSFDLPLLNPAQPANSGTQLIFTSDAGLSWRPLGNLPNPDPSSLTQQTLSLAIDAANSNIVYAGFKGAIFKSTDGGHHFAPGVTLQPVVYQVLVLVVDPSNSANIYAGTDSGVFKSADAGATWNLASSGLLNLQPPHTVGSLVIDPFHPKSIWAVAGGVGFLSTDGANSWTQLSLPAPAAGNASIFEFAFDAVTPGVVYAFGSQPPASYLLKSTDGGASWSQLNIPFTGGILVTDPVRAGRLYAIGSSGAPSSTFYRSLDAGATWQSFPFPDPLAQSLAVDPANPNILLAGMYRSADGGQTWSLTTVSREVLATFAPSGKGTAVAAAPISSDVFVAKFAPDGNTLKFATYFGGMGNETASGIQVDKSGKRSV